MVSSFYRMRAQPHTYLNPCDLTGRNKERPALHPFAVVIKTRGSGTWESRTGGGEAKPNPLYLTQDFFQIAVRTHNAQNQTKDKCKSQKLKTNKGQRGITAGRKGTESAD